MSENNTIIVVAKTETDEYGNLWVTPKGDGERVKIAKKRENLHPLFEQGKAIMLEWQSYMNKPYVANAKLVEGELPPPEKSSELLPEHQDVIDKARQHEPAPQELGMWWKELGEMLRAGDIDRTKPMGKALRKAYYAQMFSVLNIKIEDKEKEEKI